VGGIDFHKRFQLLLATEELVNALAESLLTPAFKLITENDDLPKP
jgi:hypothetical protein